ncbi:MAG: hypothetical protein ACR2PL_18640 [Dehalococcoidia bacterium]
MLRHWTELPAVLRDEFAGTLAAIYYATPALVDLLPQREVFDTPFGADTTARSFAGRLSEIPAPTIEQLGRATMPNSGIFSP